MCKVGRPRSINSPDELLKKFKEYIEYCILKDRFANLSGFFVYSGIPSSTYFDYARGEKYPEFSDTIKKIDEMLEDETLNYKILAPAVKIFYMKNKLGYKDTIENNINGKMEIDTKDISKLSDEELRELAK